MLRVGLHTMTKGKHVGLSYDVSVRPVIACKLPKVAWTSQRGSQGLDCSETQMHTEGRKAPEALQIFKSQPLLACPFPSVRSNRTVQWHGSGSTRNPAMIARANS